MKVGTVLTWETSVLIHRLTFTAEGFGLQDRDGSFPPFHPLHLPHSHSASRRSLYPPVQGEAQGWGPGHPPGLSLPILLPWGSSLSVSRSSLSRLPFPTSTSWGWGGGLLSACG